jgi:hypothetical protein
VPPTTPPPADATTFALRATELRALPNGRFEIVLELTPKLQQRQADQASARHRPEAPRHAS